MRLTNFQIVAINRLARKHFGNETKVFLFGSRTDDSKKGGDIDLLIQNTLETVLTFTAKIRFLAELKSEIGDRKIDVVFDNVSSRLKKNFYKSINSQKVEL